MDKQLVRSVAGGLGDAFSQLYDRHAPTVYGWRAGCCRRPTSPRKWCRTSFAQVWRDAARYESGRASVAGWIVMLTRARAIDRLRARRSRPDQAAGVEPAAIAPLPVSDRSPESVTIASDDGRRVREALGVLPENQRTLIDLA